MLDVVDPKAKIKEEKMFRYKNLYLLLTLVLLAGLVLVSCAPQPTPEPTAEPTEEVEEEIPVAPEVIGKEEEDRRAKESQGKE